MCVVVGLLAISLSLGHCFDHQAAFAKRLPAPLLLASIEKHQVKTARMSSSKGRKAPSRMPPSAGRIASTPHRASAISHVVFEESGQCPAAAKHIEKKGPSLDSTDKVSKDFRDDCKAEPAADSPTLDTVGGIANALTLARLDQAVNIAKSYLKNIRFNTAKYYNEQAADGIPSEQSEAIVTLAPGPSLFNEPDQGITNLKLLRKVTEKDLTADEADVESNKSAERHRKLNQRILSAHLIIGAIGTDEDLDRALMYLQILHTEPRWPEFVKQLTDAVDEEAKIKFEAARARAMELGGVQALTREDIEGLSYEQIRQLRGY